MKRKILATWIILLLVTMHCSIIQADEKNEETQVNNTMTAEIGYISENGEKISNIITVTEKELSELESQISEIFEKIKSINSWGELEKIIENLQTKKGFIMNFLTKILTKFKLYRNRGIIISNGHSYKINPFKKNDMKLRQRLAFWHYSNNEKSIDKTYIIKPFALKMKILKGFQFGVMSKFFGIYIYIANKLPKKSYTFFIGTASRINGMDFQ